jgi:hypothetical protein
MRLKSRPELRRSWGTHELSIVGQSTDGEWKRWLVLRWRNGSLEFFAKEIANSLNVPLLTYEV